MPISCYYFRNIWELVIVDIVGERGSYQIEIENWEKIKLVFD